MFDLIAISWFELLGRVRGLGRPGRMLTMSRTGSRAGSRLSVEERTRIVLAALAGEMTMAEAARRHGTSPRAIGQWRDRFVDAGKAGPESRPEYERNVPRARDQAGHRHAF